VRNDNLVHLSQVNSPGRKKAEKATVKAARRLMSSYELLLKVGTMAKSISRVISLRSRISVTPNTRCAPRMIRLMRGLSNMVVGIPRSTW
jgi:hypothetical protein